MASHYEQSQTVKQSVTAKGHIDFYRQTDYPQNQVQSNMNNAHATGNQQMFQGIVKEQQNEGGTAFANEALKESHQDPSPIYGKAQNNRPPITDNFMETHLKITDARQDEVKGKQRHQDRLKRRSIENKEAIQNIRSRGDLLQIQDQKQNQGRQMLNGAKSALSNYATSQQTNSNINSAAISSNIQGIKQINKLAKVERDPIMMVDQQHGLKRTLAKSQSQNKLLFVSPDTLLNKNNPYQDTESNGNNNVLEKNSFFKDQNNRSGTGNQVVQELLYKQHMQYRQGSTANNHKGWQLKASNHNLFLSGMTTITECTFCNKTSAGANSHSIIPHHCSAIYCCKDQQGMMIQNNLSKKYSTNRDYYNLKIVNDLIYNENTHIVSIFKDYLILDDINEFLKRSYNLQETKVRLPKLCSFYDKYSQVFPNYVCLPESKYMFKNIQRKQKLIDEQYQIQEDLAKKQHQTLLDEDRLFNTKFYNSYYSNMGDISMTKRQYEEQAKQIATQAGKKVPERGFAQLRIDELVDRFLMKDSESNIQLITTAGLDFSGFTQHQNSTFINQHQISAPVHHNPTTANNKQTANKQGSNQKSQPRNQQIAQQQKVNTKHAKKLSEEKKRPQQANVVLAQTSVATATNKRQKGSFSNSGKSTAGPNNMQEITKLDSIKVGLSNESAKATPRLNHQHKRSSTKATAQVDLVQKQTIQTSPQTKEAIANYLHNCQIEPSTETHQLTNSLAQMGPLLSPNSNGVYPNNYLESPSIKSLNTFGQKPTLLTSGSQTSLRTTTQQFQQQRHNMKSQCIIPTITLANATIAHPQKKTNRLSHGGGHKPLNQHRKNASPTPQHQNQQSSNSRNNKNMVTNSTQKSIKSVNSHAKYLSGGNEQYKKLLMNAQNNHQQQTYQTNYENTMNSHLINSSNKKNPKLAYQRSKQDLVLDTYVGTQSSNQKKQITNHLYNAQGENIDNECPTVTGEDCDDFGIADERFASPDCHNLIFSTVDDNTVGRKSIESTKRNIVQNPQQMLMLTSTEDKILQGSNNYDQIKKHLEQYIISGKGAGQQQTFDHRSVVSKKSNITRSNEKAQYEDVKQSVSSTGYNRNNLTQSAHSQANQNSQDQSSSRNGTGKKHFESLKQRIRGVFDTNQQHTSDSLGTSNKTPIKGSTQSNKAQIKLAATQNLILQQNRMSLESNQANMLLMPTSNTSQQNHPLPLSSTSSKGKQLVFNQQQRSLQQNAANYRSITNLQQRKGSNQKYENSVEAKRLSAQHTINNRQSFKDLGKQSKQSVQTVINQQKKVIKRCATGKTLNLQDVNAHSHTFGQIPQNYYNNPGSSTSTLCNPTFISTTSSNNPNPKAYQTSKQNASITSTAATHQQILAAQQQQAANTVRVMTPSYSLASLSKLISPAATNNTTSPMTMTVTNANGQTTQHVIGRKQVLPSKGKATAMGHHPANHHLYTGQGLMPSHSHNNLMADSKNKKMMGTQIQSTALNNKGVIASKNSMRQQMAKANNTVQTQMNPSTGISLSTILNQKIGRQQNLQHTMQQSSSLQNLQQITPRGIQQERKPQQIQVNNHFEMSGNLSCTVSTENNSSKYYMLSDIAAKAIESKHPKFMQTIEEQTNNQGGHQYNTMLSASMRPKKGGTGLASSMSQAQLEVKMQKQKIQTTVNSGQNTIKRNTNIQRQTLQSSQSVSHFKNPSQTIKSKRSLQGRQ